MLEGCWKDGERMVEGRWKEGGRNVGGMAGTMVEGWMMDGGWMKDDG